MASSRSRYVVMLLKLEVIDLAQDLDPGIDVALNAVPRRLLSFDFFFQAEDGIRYLTVTGVQTCALPIFLASFGDRSDGRRVQRISAVRPALSSRFRVSSTHGPRPGEGAHGITDWIGAPRAIEIGRASCRERV